MKSRQFAFALLMSMLTGCLAFPDYQPEFSLPIEQADIAQGEKNFIAMQCNRCHTIKNYDIPAYDGDMPHEVELGGVILIAKTHADLATSIMNPNYRLSDRYLWQFPREEREAIKQSPMHGAIPDMKISELIDLVAFLDSRYGRVPGYRTSYEW